MSLPDIVNIVAGVIFSLGGGGMIVFGLSSWLGKVWADRLMQSERAKHEATLKKLESQLQHESQSRLREIQNELDIFKENI